MLSHISRAGSIAIAAIGLALILPACGGNAATTTTSPPATTATSPPTTTTTLAPTTTTTTTTTTTLPPTTTTTTIPPPTVVGWDGAGISAIAVVIDFEPRAAALDMRSIVGAHLAAMGVDADDDAAVVLHLDLDGESVSEEYDDLEECHSGARVSGTVTLTAPNQSTREERISWELETPLVIFSSNCETDPDDAPYGVAFAKAFIPVLPAFWAEGSAPALIEIVADEIKIGTEDLPRIAEAIDAFRSLDPDLLDPTDIVAFLSATIDVLEYLDRGYSGHGADVAAHELLNIYSDIDYRFETTDDIAQWRDWLESWEEQHTP